MARSAGVAIGIAFVLAAGAVPGCDCSNNGVSMMDLGVPDLSPFDEAVPPDLAGSGDGIVGITDAGPICSGAGAACASGAECCSNVCDAASHVCVLPQCGTVGASCASAADCCGLACVGSKCGGQCLSDGQSCTSAGQCCSTICNGTCTPINTMCKTAGNACTASNECCNGSCIGLVANDAAIVGQCAAPSQVSFCTQIGDICAHDNECCTGICKLVSGQAVGTCAPLTNAACSVDGETCNGCGTCCSHFCGPFGNFGSSICQPASGCHVQGDTCRVNSDCCGGDPNSGLPGAGQVVCVPDPTYPTKIGTCSGPNKSNCPTPGSPTCTNTCDPAGDICHQNPTPVCAGSTTNVRNDCCACISTKDCCKPDKVGIPRCNLVGSCVQAGGNCSFSTDCCNGLPCVPDANGALHCGAMCVMQGGLCTTNADCCNGLTCVVPPGSVKGTCTNPAPPPPTDMAGVDLAPTDLGTTPSNDMALCAQYGQACSTTHPCCNNVQCTNASFGACAAGDPNCICFSPIP
ncbi:MAG TPA: hypothetical protein VFF06_20120 [Polyangia bacterium]|nr:hypothetical protein [Polyangia bacterium]